MKSTIIMTGIVGVLALTSSAWAQGGGTGGGGRRPLSHNPSGVSRNIAPSQIRKNALILSRNITGKMIADEGGGGAGTSGGRKPGKKIQA